MHWNLYHFARTSPLNSRLMYITLVRFQVNVSKMELLFSILHPQSIPLMALLDFRIEYIHNLLIFFFTTSIHQSPIFCCVLVQCIFKPAVGVIFSKMLNQIMSLLCSKLSKGFSFHSVKAQVFTMAYEVPCLPDPLSVLWPYFLLLSPTTVLFFNF